MSDTDTGDTDEGKRKREEDSPQDSQVFRKSRRTIRTPTKTGGTAAQVPKGSIAMAEDSEVKHMFALLMEEMKQLREGQDRYHNEIVQLKEENAKLNTRVEILEAKIGKIEKRERKNNIVIKGLQTEGTTVKHGVEAFLKNKLQLNVEINEAREINTGNNRKLIIVKMESWEEKIKIMKEKSKLKGTNQYIEDDLTPEERKIQATLRNMAKNEKEKGNLVKVGHQAITIEGKRWIWDQKKNKLVPALQKTM